ncbi:hypothetical protein NKG95_04675 [Mesorhizobium sp. M1423]|uniref:hypothetical protein n=1 Tax=Mesorhizobium sp. M1423 TaxID=2957101 RepID=UPI0033398C2B
MAPVVPIVLRVVPGSMPFGLGWTTTLFSLPGALLSELAFWAITAVARPAASMEAVTIFVSMLISIIRLSSHGDYRENNAGDGKVLAKMAQHGEANTRMADLLGPFSIASCRIDVVVFRFKNSPYFDR